MDDRASRPEPSLRTHAERLAALRAELARRGLTGFVVPRADEHQGEYVPPRAERLAWLTGFDGSAGMAVVLADEAALFVDGRYTLQAGEQVDAEAFTVIHQAEISATDWIADHLPAGGRLGYDPWLHTLDGIARMAAAVERAGAALEACESNPLDAVWPDQPGPPLAPVVPHPLEFAGRSSADKRAEIGAALRKERHDAAVLTLPESIAWLLNVRGGDVPRTPLPLSFAIVHADGAVDWFVDPRKAEGLDNHMDTEVRRHAPEDLGPMLDALGKRGAKVRVDPATAAAWVAQRLDGAGGTVARASDPCLLPKACKNQVELEGMRTAHRRDGVALTRFLAWLSRETPKGGLTELAAAARLEAFRREGEHYRDLSFDTISGAGPDGAIVHYRVTEASDRALEQGTLYLVDSGGQYLDGTTDVTRTVAIGEPTAEMRERFTRVLKGHIALATAVFPEGTSGSQLDALARAPLWQAGLDYDHGTGHGVGSYLSVHEGPQRISKLPNSVALRPGMVVSNEPGYYKAGAYGIRIENLITVVPVERPAGAERDLLGFETLTLAPIDLALVEPAMLTAAESAWLDRYHRRVRETVGPRLGDADRAWLDDATRALGR